MQNIIKEMKIISKEVYQKKLEELEINEFLDLMPELVGEIGINVRNKFENKNYEFQLYPIRKENELMLVFQFFEVEEQEILNNIPEDLEVKFKKMDEFEQKYLGILDHEEYQEKFKELFEDKKEKEREMDMIKDCTMSEFREHIPIDDIEDKIKFINELEIKAFGFLQKFEDYQKEEFTESFTF
jgi:hypothetical protein